MMGEEATVITVTSEADEAMVEAERKQWEAHCIYKLPPCVTHLSKNNPFKPRLVSFGPYHHGDTDLDLMESHKQRVVDRFLKRSGRSMEVCVKNVSEFTRSWMNAYHSLDPKWEQNPGAFTELMVKDGCFMLEVLRYRYFYPDGNGAGIRNCYAENDPIFSHHGIVQMMSYIERDMLMLENQLPMPLLLNLLDLLQESEDKEQYEYLIKLIVRFCAPKNSHPYEELGQEQKNDLKKCKHVLDAYRKLLIFGNRRPDTSNGPDPSNNNKSSCGGHFLDILPSATLLRDSGIYIRKSKTSSITDSTFEPSFLGGILKIPPIVVDDTTESVFLNLMAFERFHTGIGSEVTSYITFMDDIIDNHKDVSLLHTHQIIENAFGSDKAVAKLFNRLTKDTALDPECPLSSVRLRTKTHCNRKWNRWWGDFIHTYFINPWTVIAFFAVIFFFGLQVTDTIFSIKMIYQTLLHQVRTIKDSNISMLYLLFKNKCKHTLDEGNFNRFPFF